VFHDLIIRRGRDECLGAISNMTGTDAHHRFSKNQTELAYVAAQPRQDRVRRAWCRRDRWRVDRARRQRTARHRNE
jgi:hypothetical protein